MNRSLRGWVVLSSLALSMSALGAKKDDPPPPPPPPPLEETGPAPEASSSSSGSGGDWSIKGTDGLLDKGTGHVRKPMLSFFLGVPWWGYGFTPGYSSTFSLGFGGRFYLPLPFTKEGFLPMLNDSFGIEFGVDAAVLFPGFGSSIAGAIQIPAEARWNFHLFPKLEVYAKVGFALGVLFANAVYVYPVLVANVGALLKLTDAIFLRAEIGSPALKVGIGFAF